MAKYRIPAKFKRLGAVKPLYMVSYANDTKMKDFHSKILAERFKKSLRKKGHNSSIFKDYVDKNGDFI